jgi:hypothetical protein
VKDRERERERERERDASSLSEQRMRRDEQAEGFRDVHAVSQSGIKALQQARTQRGRQDGTRMWSKHTVQPV